jgi:hypothetical protein
MLKLKHGQEVTTRLTKEKMYVVDVSEHIVYLTNKADLMSSVTVCTKEKFMEHFLYVEQFVPEEGGDIFYLYGSRTAILWGRYSTKSEYLFDKVFRTHDEAQAFLDKVNAL